MPSLRPSLVFATIVILAVGAPAHADKCTGAKLKAIGKKEAGLLGCQAKVAATNDSSGLSACEGKVIGKFAAAFAKAGVCAGDQTTCENVGDGCESTVASTMTDTFPSPCEAAKRKAAGKFAKGELGCYSKAAAKGLPVDTAACIPKAQGKFSGALTKAGACPDGGSPQMLVEDNCVSPAVTTDGGGMVTDVCPTTTTTTTTSTTTSTSSTTSTTTSTTSTTSTTATTCPLPATGQITCWDSSGTVISCTGTGQDGELQKGAPLSYTDNGDGTITDNNTGLVWEKQSMDGSVHDVNNQYSWADAFAVHIATLNTMAFAGHADWRVPNAKELESIVHYQDAAFISPVFHTGCTAGCTVLTCSCNAARFYWTSTSRPNALGDAMCVSFQNGNGEGMVTTLGKASFPEPVRAVRGGSSCLPATGQTTCWNSSGTVISCAGTGQDGELQKGAPLSYTDNGDGTITDGNTGLQWEKLSGDGSVHDVGTSYIWANAFSGHVATLNTMAFAGHADWRVPNAREIESIINYGQTDQNTISPIFKTNCNPGCTVLTCSCNAGNELYYASSSVATAPSLAWLVHFGDGGLLEIGKANALHVRAVRGGL